MLPGNITKESFSTGEAARLLGLPRRTVGKYCEVGKIKASQNQISKRWTISQDDLVEFMKQYGLIPGEKSPRGRILIVDDEPGVIKLISKILLGSGRNFSIDTAENGFEALIKIGAEVPDLVFLDIHMPRVDGRDILTAIKKGPGTKNIKVVVVTGHPEDIDEMITLGADEALTKPFKKEQLLQRVETYLPAGRNSSDR